MKNPGAANTLMRQVLGKGGISWIFFNTPKEAIKAGGKMAQKFQETLQKMYPYTLKARNEIAKRLRIKEMDQVRNIFKDSFRI